MGSWSQRFSVAGRRALVTGAAGGIGSVICSVLADAGADIAAVDRDLTELEPVVEAVRGDGRRCEAFAADLATIEGPRAAAAAALAAFGGIDILVNNVGSSMGTDLLGTGDEVWQQALEQNLYPSIRASRLAVPYMEQRGGGAIIIIASIYGREAGGRMTYNAVKAAEISLAKSLAQQLAPMNIRVNSVSPGSILFEGGSWWKRQQDDPAAIAEFVKRELPFGRFGRPEEVGDVVAYLASPRASWISGTSVVVDGCQSRAF